MHRGTSQFAWGVLLMTYLACLGERNAMFSLGFQARSAQINTKAKRHIYIHFFARMWGSMRTDTTLKRLPGPASDELVGTIK